MISIDKHRGSEMYEAMVIHKLTILLSALVGANILLLLILPYFLLVCNLFMVDYSKPSCHKLLNGTRRESNIMESIFQGMKAYRLPPPINIPRYYQLPLLYGSFEPVEPEVDQGESPISILKSIYEGHVALIYACTVVLCLVGVTVYFFRQTIQLIRGVIYEQTADTWFRNLFASWNFSNVCQPSNYLKHQSLYNHIKQKMRFSKYQRQSCGNICLLMTGRIFGVTFTLAIWVLTVVSVHFACIFKPRNILDSLINSGYMVSESTELALGRFLVFLPACLVVLVKLIVPPVSRLIGRIESYPLTIRVTLYSARMFSARVVAIFTLVTTSFHLQLSGKSVFSDAISSTNGTTPLPAPKVSQLECWEDGLCLHLVSIACLDFVADFGLILLIRFPRVIIQSICHQTWSCSVKLNFDPYETIIDLVTDLSLITIGILHCPIIPVIVCAKLLLTYGLKLFHLWVNCSTSREIHSAAYVKFLFVGFSSVTVLFSLISLVFAMTYIDVSKSCGPFKSQTKMWDVFAAELSGLPKFAQSSFTVISLTYFMVSAIFVLMFGLYISHLKRLSIEKNANELKCQLAITTQEKCYLISKIKKPKQRPPSVRQNSIQI